MPTYEVTYEVGEGTESELIEAESPVEAEQKFKSNHSNGNTVVLCVVRQ